MLHETIGVFLDSVTEREFDPVLLALLAAQGFQDIHFIHGGFEFGKDVIAKRADPITGELRQYAIQSKAGDIGQATWRTIRPQIEEAEYNTRAHPGFDAALPRVAVLLTTGRLKGAAPVDAQEYKETVEARKLASFEIWDHETLIRWITKDPTVALLSLSEQVALHGILADIQEEAVDEPALERATRRWKDTSTGSAAVESAILISAFRQAQRLDLAAMCALHFFRGMRVRATSPQVEAEVESARRLFQSVCMLLLDEIQPLLDDPAALASVDPSPASLVSYAVTAVRVAELLALGALSIRDGERAAVLEHAVHALVVSHPGTARPVSDQFAVSIIPIVCVLQRTNPMAAAEYLRSVATWLMNRSDPDKVGLGLGTLEESPRAVVERLLGGALASSSLVLNRSTYLLTVLLDLCLALNQIGLLADVLADARALRLTACTTTVPAESETFRRVGGAVIPVPRVEYTTNGRTYPQSSSRAPSLRSR